MEDVSCETSHILVCGKSEAIAMLPGASSPNPFPLVTPLLFSRDRMYKYLQSKE